MYKTKKSTSAGSRIAQASVCVLLLFAIGCVENRQFAGPQLQPCPSDVGQRRIQRFDPYPDPNIGPEIPGARPIGYEIPPTERYVSPTIAPSESPAASAQNVR
ncbi:MAG: hypothetical protein Q4D38_07630 [Planctomycetia bacterium]|nr:hypothetical protein [Planctomycetia bacterium]